MDVATLSLNSTLLHQVGKKTGGKANVTLSETAAVLKPSDKGFIMLRLIKALQSFQVPVIESDPTDTATGAAIAGSILRGAATLVDGSRDLATRLASTQHHMASEGLLLVGEVTDGTGATGLLVAKLEHEQGIQAVPSTSKGLATFEVNVIPDLVLSDAGKVYKVGLFETPAKASDPMTAGVVDRQASNRVVAQYFLSEYLGCELLEKPDVLTERFVDATKTFIAALKDPHRAAEVQVAVLAELQSQRARISVPAFVKDHLLASEEPEFRQKAAAVGLPWRSFEKDVARVKGRIQTVRIGTERGVTVLAPPAEIHSEENPEGSVRVSESGANHAVVIDGKVTTVDGGRARG